jgi:hypothetical protein
MSTCERLAALVAAGTLRQFVPLVTFPGNTVVRELFVADDLYQWLSRTTDTIDDANRLTFTHQRLGLFIFGDYIDNRNYMKRLLGKPHGVWEFLSSAASIPQFRLFGAFRELDCFIGLSWRWRNHAAGKWSEIKRGVAQDWDGLFPGIPRHTGPTFDHYVSNGGHYAWDGS